ncbi:MAG: phosphoglycolate phosphatase [Alphaproteobacteria bacterium]|nr:phosphoglycolate phosphatase [Alphaproteobacteria bacterium]
MPTPLVIFDLDGTLLDTAPDLMKSLNETIGDLGLEPVRYDDITFLVGAGARAMIVRALEMRNTVVHDSEIERLFGRFIEFYANSMPGVSTPYPGLIEALDRLDAAGMSLAVCTNKTESLARRLLDLLDLTGRFSAITGGDTFPVRKPHGDHIHGTIEMALGSSNAAVMIGDSINDIHAAKNAGIPSIAVPFGYSDTAVQHLGPNRIIQHYDELTPDLVTGLLSRA